MWTLYIDCSAMSWTGQSDDSQTANTPSDQRGDLEPW